MELPKGGVNELLKSDSGRKYLALYQKVNRIALLQPKNTDGSRNNEFFKVYGKDVDNREKKHQEQVRQAKREWEEKSKKK